MEVKYFVSAVLCVLMYYTITMSSVQATPVEDIACENNTCGTGVETKSANPPSPSKQSGRKSCDQVRCPSGTYCVNGKCVTSCDEVDCGPGEKCDLETVNCFTAPCPPVPTCKPFDRCSIVRCKSGYECLNGSGSCVPTCNGFVCGPGEKCVLETVNCFTTPCPPVPTCKPFDKCSIVRCKSGYECLNGSCIPTCNGFVCGPNEECYLKSVQCVRAPCFPVPACRPVLTCKTINCLSGYICVNRRCIPDPCKDFSCQPGQQCYLDMEKCTTAHCPPPKPVCRGSCANILCPTHTNCIDGQCIPITTCSEGQA